MMNKKLSLSTLKVNSFITALDTQLAETAKGGGRSRLAGTCANNCDILCEATCDRSRVAGSCGTSCGGVVDPTTGGNDPVGVETNPGR